MPNYEATSIRAHLEEYLKNLNDLLTTPEELDLYADFCRTLGTLGEMTNALYEPQEDGSFIPLNQELLLRLRTLYRHGIEQADQLLSGPKGGVLDAQIKNITETLSSLMEADLSALDMLDPTHEKIGLPEAIGKAREQVVDLGNQEIPIVRGMLSNRQHMIVAHGDVLEEGYFTATNRAEPQKEFRDLMERIAKEHPDYTDLIREIQKTELEQHATDDDLRSAWRAYDQVGEQKDPERLRWSLRNHWKNKLFTKLKISSGIYEPLLERDDFLHVMDEIAMGMKPIQSHYRLYASGNVTRMKEGANLDRRNTALYRVAAFLGKKDLVAEARPMTIKQGGVEITGTFMKAVQGVDFFHLKEGDPHLEFQQQNFDNPAVYEDIAAMQAIDYLCGNVDRHPGNFMLRFDPAEGKDAKLVGISLIDNDLSFSHALDRPDNASFFALPEQMGVIGEKTYAAIQALTVDQMEMLLRDCGLSAEEVEMVMERRQRLIERVEADREFFNDLPVGETLEGRIRIVKEGEWDKYSLSNLAKEHRESQFSRFNRMHSIANGAVRRHAREDTKKEAEDARRYEALGLQPVGKQAAPTEVPVGKVIGNGPVQDVIAPEETTLRLALPPLGKIQAVGANLSRRYPVSWMENGKEKKGFFTEPRHLSLHHDISLAIQKQIEDDPEYAVPFLALRDYYLTEDLLHLKELPVDLGKLPWKDMGFTEGEIEGFRQDPKFQTIYKAVRRSFIKISDRETPFAANALVMGIEARVDLRNVAMSEVGDALGSPDTLARSRVTEVECDGHIMDGVVMDLAEGYDYSVLAKGDHPVSQIPQDRINDVYNTPEGLKSIADIQLIDYVCLNVDRHNANMFYRFENPGTDQVRFVGVQGIDNDCSFGAFSLQPEIPMGNLPALNNMKVISAEMYDRIMDPKTAEVIADKLRKNKLSEKEIQAAMNRLKYVQEAVNSGKMRVVGAEEWAKGEYTFEKLSESGMFLRVMSSAKAFATAGEKYLTTEQNPQKQEAMKEEAGSGLVFVKGVKVDRFGKELLENTEFLKLRTTAELEYENQLKETINHVPRKEGAPVVAEVSGAGEMLDRLIRSGRDMYQRLDNADPWYHGTSREYKAYKASCYQLEQMAKEIKKSLPDQSAGLKEADIERLRNKLNEIKDRNAIYQTKKQNEEKRGIAVKPIGQLRMQVGKEVVNDVTPLELAVQSIREQQLVKESPITFINSRLANTGIRLDGLRGKALQDMVAEVLYLKALSRTSVENKKPESMVNAVRPEVIKAQTEVIAGGGAFRKLIKEIPEDKLRQLATEQRGEKIYDRFLDHLAREKQVGVAAGRSVQNEIKQPVVNGPINGAM